MKDTRTVEGSPERAADRGRMEDLGFSLSEKPSLGNPDVVRGMVTEFASQIVEARKLYNQDQLTGEQTQERVRELAREYGDIVMGRDERYDPLPWHDPSRLGRRVGLVVPPIEGISDPGEVLFLTVGTSLMSIAAALEEESLEDNEAQQETTEMLEDTANLILGLR